ncbi:MAG: hydrogenase iron-sulfur subunit, partial [Deltaproteobacteria bacterium]|nr:hydrogenase iron-sulfur subunit [Deltaproteobacteria bacterium]
MTNEESGGEFQPKIIAFLCNWCSYGAADLAGVSRMAYPPNIRVIRIPCTGRMSPKFVLEAFRRGADGVWVSGCQPGDCHYIAGNYHARR